MRRPLQTLGLVFAVTISGLFLLSGCAQPDKKDSGLSDQPWGSGYNDHNIPPGLLEGR